MVSHPSLTAALPEVSGCPAPQHQLLPAGPPRRFRGPPRRFQCQKGGAVPAGLFQAGRGSDALREVRHRMPPPPTPHPYAAISLLLTPPRICPLLAGSVVYVFYFNFLLFIIAFGGVNVADPPVHVALCVLPNATSGVNLLACVRRLFFLAELM